MNRTELLNSMMQAYAVAEMAGTKRDLLTASSYAYACKVAELMLTNRIGLLPEGKAAA